MESEYKENYQLYNNYDTKLNIKFFILFFIIFKFFFSFYKYMLQK